MLNNAVRQRSFCVSYHMIRLFTVKYNQNIYVQTLTCNLPYTHPCECSISYCLDAAAAGSTAGDLLSSQRLRASTDLGDEERSRLWGQLGVKVQNLPGGHFKWKTSVSDASGTQEHLQTNHLGGSALDQGDALTLCPDALEHERVCVATVHLKDE